jgi:hypothetical protein
MIELLAISSELLAADEVFTTPDSRKANGEEHQEVTWLTQ